MLEDCRVSLLTERRAARAGGQRRAAETARRGRNLLNGEELPAKVTRRLRAGDVLRIETPGGGGSRPAAA